MSHRDTLRALLRGGLVKRSADLLAAGIDPKAIAQALQDGDIVRPTVGVYHLRENATPRWRVDIAAACVRVPRAVVSLTSAARLCKLSRTGGEMVWLGIPAGLHGSMLEPIPHRLLSWSWDGALTTGVTTTEVCGVPVSVTTPTRTVVDLFRYSRHLSGEEPALEAMRGLMRTADCRDELMDMAQATGAPARTRDRLDVLSRAFRPTRVEGARLAKR